MFILKYFSNFAPVNGLILVICLSSPLLPVMDRRGFYYLLIQCYIFLSESMLFTINQNNIAIVTVFFVNVCNQAVVKAVRAFIGAVNALAYSVRLYFISRYQVINQLLPLNSVNFNAEIIAFKVYHNLTF